MCRVLSCLCGQQEQTVKVNGMISNVALTKFIMDIKGVFHCLNCGREIRIKGEYHERNKSTATQSTD